MGKLCGRQRRRSGLASTKDDRQPQGPDLSLHIGLFPDGQELADLGVRVLIGMGSYDFELAPGYPKTRRKS